MLESRIYYADSEQHRLQLEWYGQRQSIARLCTFSPVYHVYFAGNTTCGTLQAMLPCGRPCDPESHPLRHPYFHVILLATVKSGAVLWLPPLQCAISTSYAV